MSAVRKIRILVVEDSAADVLLLQEALAELDGMAHDVLHCESLSGALASVAASPPDVALLDLGLPDSQGLGTFLDFHHHAPDVPALVLTALDDTGVGLKAVQEGAQDYLIKKQIQSPLLGRAIRYAIERNRLSVDVQHSRDRLRMLAGHLEAIREDERTRISREVHDELGQKLTGLKLDLRWLKVRLAQPPSADATVAMAKRAFEAEKLADQLLDAVKRIAIELRPGTLDHLGLADAIRDESRRFEARSGVHMVLDLPEQRTSLKPEVATVAFRVLQELLTNVARHASAKTVEIRLVENDRMLHMDVRDDGVGMQVDKVEGNASLGLLGIQERLAAHHGTLNLESAPDRGVCARVRIPI